MAQVYRMLMVNLNQISGFVVDFLVEAESDFMGIHFFDISYIPSGTARDIEPYRLSPFGRFCQLGNFRSFCSFVLT